MAKKGGKVCFSMAPFAAATVVRKRGKGEKKRKVLVSCVGGGGGSRHANILPLPLLLPLLLVFTAPRGIFKEGRVGGGVSAEWKGAYQVWLWQGGIMQKKGRFGWGMLYPIWRDRRRIGRPQKEKPFVPKRSEEKGLIRFAVWQTLLMIIS